ncbi:hypothetical protein F444_07398 [Phytophthora nicotianae P1976]|uniref:Uncharacterized protein n=1 Tax=Phytophthora nicotianae P1976 TaxID=1317066 RepID=A0A081AET8_PHYNI|nr:hypothetical protein F444_07398 [Phytophthora nicotianae P1976]
MKHLLPEILPVTHTSTSAETYRMSSQHVTPQHLPPGFESLSSFIKLPSIHPPQVFSEELMEFAEELPSM